MRIALGHECAALIPAFEGVADVRCGGAGNVVTGDDRCRGGMDGAGPLRRDGGGERTGLNGAAERGSARQRDVAHGQILAILVALRHAHHHLPGIAAGRCGGGHVERHVIVVGIDVGMAVHLAQFVSLCHLAVGIQLAHNDLKGRRRILHPRRHAQADARRHIGQLAVGFQLQRHAVVVGAVGSSLYLEAQQGEARHLLRGVARRRDGGLEGELRAESDARAEHLRHIGSFAGDGCCGRFLIGCAARGKVLDGLIECPVGGYHRRLGVQGHGSQQQGHHAEKGSSLHCCQ